jgi:hypothetical protein
VCRTADVGREGGEGEGEEEEEEEGREGWARESESW